MNLLEQNFYKEIRRKFLADASKEKPTPKKRDYSIPRKWKTVSEVIAVFNDSSSVREVAAKLGCSFTTAYYRLRDLGLAYERRHGPKPRDLSLEQKKSIAALARGSAKIHEISREYEIPSQTVFAATLEMVKEDIRKFNLKHTFFLPEPVTFRQCCIAQEIVLNATLFLPENRKKLCEMVQSQLRTIDMYLSGVCMRKRLIRDKNKLDQAKHAEENT